MQQDPAERSSGDKAGNATIGDPIVFIRAEHDRQCEICDRLDNLPNELDGGLDGDWIRSICDFLSTDLPMHVKDEEKDLFPILSRRCAGSESLELVLSQLESEHELDLDLVEPIHGELLIVLERGRPRDPARFLTNLRAFAETQRRHLLWENRVVLPLAERHLTNADKSDLRSRLAARRRAQGHAAEKTSCGDFENSRER